MKTFLLALCAVFFTACGTITPTSITLGNSGKNVDFYMDYTCPGCKRAFENTLLPMVETGQIRLRLHDFPLTGAGLFAHNAVWCAAKNGKEKEMVTYLFANQEAQRIFQIAGYGEKLGLGDEFRTCIENQEFSANIEQEKKRGVERGVTLTPTVFIGNTKFEMSILPSELEDELK